MDKQKKQQIAELLKETGHQHHKAFFLTNGFDPEWPLWYADHLKKSLPKLLGTKMTRSRIIFELVRLDDSTDTSQEHWTQVYAEELLNKYG